MQKSLVRKGLVIGIIVLFVGAGVIPSMGGTVVEKTSKKPISDGNTLYVGGSGEGNYTSIQDAIDDAYDGDTVFVYGESSPYYENIEVDKQINLIGEDRNITIIDGDRNESTVNIKTDWVNISEFTIYNGSYAKGAIYIEEFDFNTIYKNIIVGYEDNFGMVLFRSDGNNISKNVFKNNCEDIYILSSDNNIIYRNIITGIIDIYFSNQNTVIENQVIGVGINNGRIDIYNGSHNNKILRNNIYCPDRYRGAFFDYDYPHIRDNTWLNNYWNRPRILPKPIFGRINFDREIYLPWVTFDWRPALRPYDIPQIVI